MWLSKRNTQEPHQGNESEKMADSMRTMRGTNGNNEWHRTHEENHHFFIKKAEFYQSRENVKKKWKIDRKNFNLWHHSTFFSHANRFPSWHFSALNRVGPTIHFFDWRLSSHIISYSLCAWAIQIHSQVITISFIHHGMMNEWFPFT